MKTKIKCSVCRSRFHAKKEYMIEKMFTGLASLGASDMVYDAMDCPECGCQIVLAERKPKIYPNCGAKMKGGA